MKCKVCELEIKSDSKWDRIRASAIGWFEQKDGTVYCPDHKPEWLEQWRGRKSRSE